MYFLVQKMDIGCRSRFTSTQDTHQVVGVHYDTRCRYLERLVHTKPEIPYRCPLQGTRRAEGGRPMLLIVPAPVLQDYGGRVVHSLSTHDCLPQIPHVTVASPTAHYLSHASCSSKYPSVHTARRLIPKSYSLRYIWLFLSPDTRADIVPSHQSIHKYGRDRAI